MDARAQAGGGQGHDRSGWPSWPPDQGGGLGVMVACKYDYFSMHHRTCISFPLPRPSPRSSPATCTQPHAHPARGVCGARCSRHPLHVQHVRTLSLCGPLLFTTTHPPLRFVVCLDARHLGRGGGRGGREAEQLWVRGDGGKGGIVCTPRPTFSPHLPVSQQLGAVRPARKAMMNHRCHALGWMVGRVGKLGIQPCLGGGH